MRIVLLLLLTISTTLGFTVEPLTLKSFSGADTIILTNTVELDPPREVKCTGITLDGTPVTAYKMSTQEVFPPFRNAKHCIFFSHNHSAQDEEIIGTDQDIIQYIGKYKDPLLFLADLVSNETNPQAVLQQVHILLCLDKKFHLNPTFLRNTDDTTKGMIDICRFAESLDNSGINVLSDKLSPALDSLHLKNVEFSLLDDILFYISTKTNPTTYPTVARYIRYKGGEASAQLLCDISKYAHPDDLSDVIAIFNEPGIPKDLEYACVQNFCYAYSEPIISSDFFNADRMNIVKHWKDKFSKPL
jgi:hypothetical protein